jgi:oligopeptidase A
MSHTENTNPLLTTHGLPQYASIESAHVVPAVEKMIAEVSTAFEKVENNAEPTWHGLMAPLDNLDRIVNAVWGPVGH